MPHDVLCGLIYDHLSQYISDLDKLLDVPLGVHPQNTREAKEARARQLAEIKAGNF